MSLEGDCKRHKSPEGSWLFPFCCAGHVRRPIYMLLSTSPTSCSQPAGLYLWLIRLSLVYKSQFTLSGINHLLLLGHNVWRMILFRLWHTPQLILTVVERSWPFKHKRKFSANNCHCCWCICWHSYSDSYYSFTYIYCLNWKLVKISEEFLHHPP